MGVLMAVNDIWRTRAYTFQNNQLGVNVYYHRVSAVGGSPMSDVMFEALSGSIAAAYKAIIANTASYDGLGSSRIFPTSSMEEISISGNGVGTAGAPGPGQVSGIITRRTNNPGVGGRGRVYIPFPSIADMDVDGIPVVGYVTKLDAIAATMLAPGPLTITVVGDSVILRHVLVKYSAPPPPITFVSAADLTGFVSRRKWASQHRRGDYGALNRRPF